MYIIFAAIGNFYYVGIYHSVDLYQYIALYSIAIVNYDYWRKIKNREKKKAYGCTRYRLLKLLQKFHSHTDFLVGYAKLCIYTFS